MSGRLRRLHVHRFRRVAPDTALEFDPAVNVVLGQNGSGKTTLLNLLAEVLSGRVPTVWKEGGSFSAEFDVTWAPRPASPEVSGTMVVSYASKVGQTDGSEMGEELELALTGAGQGTASLRYRDGRVVVKIDGKPAWEGSALPPKGDLFGLALKVDDPPQWARAWGAGVAGFEAVTRYAEGQEQFDALLRATVEWHGPPAGGRTLAATPWGLVEGFPGEGSPPTARFELGHSAIHEAVRAMGFEGAEVFMRPEDTDAVPIVYSDLEMNVRRRDGSTVREDKLSWGQKRFLSWWVHLASQRNYAIADELTNGLHHSWISDALDRLAGRQAFLATQNPLLLDHLEFSGPAEIERRFVLCSVRPPADGERERLEWRNATTAEAHRVFAAYQVGIQHVSELLRMEGLW